MYLYIYSLTLMIANRWLSFQRTISFFFFYFHYSIGYRLHLNVVSFHHFFHISYISMLPPFAWKTLETFDRLLMMERTIHTLRPRMKNWNLGKSRFATILLMTMLMVGLDFILFVPSHSTILCINIVCHLSMRNGIQHTMYVCILCDNDLCSTLRILIYYNIIKCTLM